VIELVEITVAIGLDKLDHPGPCSTTRGQLDHPDQFDHPAASGARSRLDRPSEAAEERSGGAAE
jgi:hypothetical protein